MENILHLLSRSLRWAKWVFLPLLGLVYVAILADIVLESVNVTALGLITLVMAPLGIWLLYRRFDTSFATAYDSDFLYLYKSVGTEQIPLGRVHQIKYVFFKISYRHRWRIGYYDTNNQERIVRVLPVGFSGRSIDGFIAAVRRHNPQVEVRHWYLFFDQ
ncbi:MAG: hypothetical protein ACRYFX_17250 [Janthinobacterium lividum]